MSEPKRLMESDKMDNLLTVFKLSKQQKLILVALQSQPDQREGFLRTDFCQLYRLILIVTGVDAARLYHENREFYLYTGRGGAKPWMRQYQVDRTVYNTNRKAVNKAYATVSRSLARLYSRGLLAWRFTGRNRRYPVLTDEGRRAVDGMNPTELAEMSARVDQVEMNGKSKNGTTAQNEWVHGPIRF